MNSSTTLGVVLSSASFVGGHPSPSAVVRRPSSLLIGVVHHRWSFVDVRRHGRSSSVVFGIVVVAAGVARAPLGCAAWGGKLMLRVRRATRTWSIPTPPGPNTPGMLRPRPMWGASSPPWRRRQTASRARRRSGRTGRRGRGPPRRSAAGSAPRRGRSAAGGPRRAVGVARRRRCR